MNEQQNLNETDYLKNLTIASEIYLNKKEIPTAVLLNLVPDNDAEFEVYYGTTYPDHKLSETGFFYNTSQLIFEQVTAHKNNDFYLPSLQLISYADGEFAEIFIEYLKIIIEMDKQKFCAAVREEKYRSYNPIKYYFEMNHCK
ncbi:hypothetical protein ACFO3O_16790 [Dokdonia ponticola]|uniref:Uncharacterized protein n=1 Tax=Dokdonia ponticola TaxID=2041041 RepID=A0ABV9I2V7_9FLAO